MLQHWHPTSQRPRSRCRFACPVPPPIPVFILGDFNARHKTWDPSIETHKTEVLMGTRVNKRLVGPTAHTLCRGLPKLTLLNNRLPRHRIPTRAESGTVIDLAMTSHPHGESMHVMFDSVLGSDHWPITLSISNTAPVYEPVRSEPDRGHINPSPVDMENKYDEPDEKHDNPPPVTRASTRCRSALALYEAEHHPGSRLWSICK